MCYDGGAPPFFFVSEKGSSILELKTTLLPNTFLEKNKTATGLKTSWPGYVRNENHAEKTKMVCFRQCCVKELLSFKNKKKLKSATSIVA